MNQVLSCRKLFAEPEVLQSIAFVLFIVFFFFDSCVGQKGLKSRSFINTSYFERISDLERKLWIAEEHYRRQNYGIYLMTDATYDQLC